MESTLEGSISALRHALDFIRSQNHGNANDESIRLVRSQTDAGAPIPIAEGAKVAQA